METLLHIYASVAVVAAFAFGLRLGLGHDDGVEGIEFILISALWPLWLVGWIALLIGDAFRRVRS
jgi:hypothetical protein